MNINEKAFDYEYLRHKLATENNISEFVKLYNKKYPEITNNNTSNYWDKENFVYDTFKDKYPMGWDKMNIIAKWIISHENINKILNIGFGSGFLEDLILPYNTKYDWHGVDISVKSVNYVQKHYPKSKFIKGNIYKTKYPNNYFDLIIASEVLEHISPSKILISLKEINRILKYNGYFICSIPLNEGLEDLLRDGNNPIQHVRIYTYNIISTELNISRFKVLRKEYLYAFHKYYCIKKYIAKILKINKPNNLIIESVKY